MTNLLLQYIGPPHRNEQP